MGFTVNITENQSIQVTEQLVDTKPPDRVAFAVEGVISMTEELLGEFSGSSLKPIEIDVSVAESRTVEIDLSDQASLRLDTVDIGVETPGTDDLSPGMETVNSSADDGDSSSDTRPGAIAFTVEGAINDVPDGEFESITGASPELETITFAVGESVRGDGGSGADVVVEIALLGYGVTVHRNGTIDIGMDGGTIDVGLP